MTRDEAYNLLTQYLTNKALIRHSLATEAAMRALANYFGDDEDTWALTGLLHDADYELCKGHPEKHGLMFFEKEKNIPEDIAHAIKAHNYKHTKVQPETKMDWAITCCDELTGLIVAETYLLPSRKVKDVKVDYVMKRLKQKDFVKGADRTNIFLCDEKLKIPLIEFVTMTLTAMQNTHEALGL